MVRPCTRNMRPTRASYVPYALRAMPLVHNQETFSVLQRLFAASGREIVGGHPRTPDLSAH